MRQGFRSTIFLLLSVLPFATMLAQERSFVECERSLNRHFQQLRNDTCAQSKRQTNTAICREFAELLKREASITYDFKQTEGLKKVVSKDARVAVYSWCYVSEGEQLVFNAIVQQRTRKGITVYALPTQEHPFVPSDNGCYDEHNWYGALYYEMHPFYSKKGKAYLLLGWAQNTPFLNMKVMEVLWFDNNGAHLGLPAFEVLNNELLSRVVFQYNKEVSMTLIYEPNKQRFVFDHLAPVNSAYVGDFRYYAPDSSYDAYRKNLWARKWVLQENVNVENK